MYVLRMFKVTRMLKVFMLLFHRDMLELGRSQSWTRALKTISGDTRMDATALLDYFQKLYDWLKADNLKNKRTVGWKKADPCE